ncbi:MAG: winged helix-turn-helix transcriptional regulator [Ignavibacteria bacterium]|jgi:DNA-binding transcriptional ArsR family regulator|nr:winged helix-turn-helix transcriptional regulator [Ignavibacteria bacterium]
MNVCIRVLADIDQINRCRDVVENLGREFSRVATVLDLAGNEVRLKILFLLEKERELCPCDLSDILNMSVPAISQHLRKLKDVGLITARKTGQTIFYSIVEEQLPMLRSLFDFLGETAMQPAA